MSRKNFFGDDEIIVEFLFIWAGVYVRNLEGSLASLFGDLGYGIKKKNLLWTPYGNLL